MRGRFAENYSRSGGVERPIFYGWICFRGSPGGDSASSGINLTASGGTGDVRVYTGGVPSGTTERLRIGNTGNVGIGTTSPSQLLSVAGQCVTGDTRLRRREKRRGANGEWVHDYDEVMIKDIQPGDEVASLDETTGDIAYRRVNGLLDMGIKTTYRLTTEDGREIRTTANHPYYVKAEKEKPAFGADFSGTAHSIVVRDCHRASSIADSHSMSRFRPCPTISVP